MRTLIALALLCAACGSGKPADKPAAPAPPSNSGTASAPAEDLRKPCCEQCASASGRDPSGMDVRTKTCTSYRGQVNGAPGVDETCATWFQAQPKPVLVMDCEAP